MRKWAVPLPEVHTHGTESDIENNLERLMPNEWVLDGNQLRGTTKDGHIIVQNIPTNKILIGKDAEGLPIFREIVL